jgi:hypothetical protein
MVIFVFILLFMRSRSYVSELKSAGIPLGSEKPFIPMGRSLKGGFYG